MIDNEVILHALYENRKMSLLINYRLYGEKCGYSTSYIYAIAKDLYPYFDESETEGRLDPYKECYKISEEEVNDIITFIDDEWLKGVTYTFYEIERKFGGRGSRIKLLRVLRYTFLDERFDDEVWTKLLLSCPTEARSITKNDVNSWEI